MRVCIYDIVLTEMESSVKVSRDSLHGKLVQHAIVLAPFYIAILDSISSFFVRPTNTFQ